MQTECLQPSEIVLAEAVADAIARIQPGARDDEKMRTAALAIMRLMPDLSFEQAVSKARLVAAL